jgi:murein DD-endopeptidase MepM/ murein hydrolase activator NlpD
MKASAPLAAAVAIAALLPLATRSAAFPSSAAGGDPLLAVADLDRRLADVDAQEKSDRMELSRTAERVALARARLIAHGRAFYRLTRAGLLPAGGGFGALVTHAMHVERARRLVSQDLEERRKLHGRAEDLANELERLARDRVDLASQRQAMDASRLAAEDDRRRQAAFDKAFETSTGAGEYVAVYGGAGGLSPDTPAGGFADARGRLLFPVAGRAEVRPARRDGTAGPGLEIRADAGSAVRAVFAGRIAFADRYGPYGRIVIVDHGSHYYTVSGNLDEIDVKTGEDVGAGQRIGTVGDDGQGSMLYFEVRQGSRTVPPGVWLGL